LDARYVLTIGQEPHGEQEDVFSNFEVTGGLVFRQAERNRDTDLDGILDRDDVCIEEPEDRDTFEDWDGCPDIDNDQDGVLDVDDDCMHEAEDFDEFEDWDGCPEFDNDHDGFDDYEDECPYKAEDRDGYRDGDGCPELDNDADGIPDLNDRCPNHPEDLDGFEDNDGCEDTDNDSDGHPDVVDACENDPETWNGFEDRDGCPDETPRELERFTGVIKGINFEVNSDQITVSSYQVLNEAADVLMKYPDLKIEVQGHTDSDGSDDFNFELSDRRAAAVVAYLVDRGVPAERLTWMGYGESRPLLDNDSTDAKAVNRRVEFHVVEAN
jgi:outer membrane protein OmpA-like peptidoglycan-associated protein